MTDSLSDSNSETNEPYQDEALEDGSSTGHGESSDQQKIRHLKGITAIRTRPGMYIGPTDLKGLHHLVWEVVDNSVDEAANGFADYVQIKVNLDGSVTCTDNGRGIPVAVMEGDGKTTFLSGSCTDRNTCRREIFPEDGYKTGTGAYMELVLPL